MASKYGKDTIIIWKDRKRFMGMPLSFTRYILAEKENNWVKLFQSIGFFSTKEEEVNAYRVIDISLKRNLADKIFRVGSLQLTCKDATTPSLILRKIKKPYEVRDIITEIVERERNKKRIRVNEFHTTDGDMMDDDFT
ncbi:MAG: PH domain-containing protein [Christensenellales bacterium]|jgi:hypothetical protein